MRIDLERSLKRVLRVLHALRTGLEKCGLGNYSPEVLMPPNSQPLMTEEIDSVTGSERTS
jgi:hypothetical protein